MNQRVETVVIGAGQCGLAMSACLRDAGREHIVVERGDVAQAWRERWDSLTLLSPNWFTRLPKYAYGGSDPDGFMGRDEIVRFFLDYAVLLQTPLDRGFDVVSITPRDGSGRMIVAAADGRAYHTDNVVVAIGGYHEPKIPSVSETLPPAVAQVHSLHYRNPEQLPDGAVLVVGAGASGQQIAEELLRAGRTVYLAVGTHNKLPRRYRGRDVIWWMEQLGTFDATVGSLPSYEAAMRKPSVSLTGVEGGHDLDLTELERDGMILVGRIAGAEGSRLSFAADLQKALTEGEKVYTDFVASVDRHIETHKLDAPAPDARPQGLDRSNRKAIATLDLTCAGIGTIIWATGFNRNFDWIESPAVAPGCDPVHARGISTQPGLYFLGLRWLYTRRSNFIDGAGADAAYLRDHIVDRAT
jgi:putative flavoprotein involved in K+ transport